MRTWKIIDRGSVPEQARKAELTCLACGIVATIPVVGIVMAQVGHGLVFDIGEHDTPKVIQCRNCLKKLQKD